MQDYYLLLLHLLANVAYLVIIIIIVTSRLFLKTTGGIVLGSVAVSAVSAVSADVLLYISVAIKASFLKLGMWSFLKCKIVHLMEVFKIFGKKSSAHGISKTTG